MNVLGNHKIYSDIRKASSILEGLLNFQGLARLSVTLDLEWVGKFGDQMREMPVTDKSSEAFSVSKFS